MDPIVTKYDALGGPASFLGTRIGDEIRQADGLAQQYQRGWIYFSPATSAHEVHGAILAKYLERGGPAGLLGYPVTDELGTPDGVGRFNHFAGGSIYWTPGTGAHEVHGAIRVYWAQLGWERSSLGYPISDENPTQVGARSDFQRGYINWIAVTGQTFAGPLLAGRTVVLDPGHNGGNAQHPTEINAQVRIGNGWKECDTVGTTSTLGYPEADYNFDVAQRVAAYLEAEGARVVLTRPDNGGWGPCITTRAAIGNEAHADAAISLHADGGPPSGRGFHVIEPGLIPGLTTEQNVFDSDRLARAVRAAYAADSGLPPANYVGGGSGLVARTDLGGLNLSVVPKVFLETANMQNGTDAAIVSDPGRRQTIAAAVGRGLTDYLLTPE